MAAAVATSPSDWEDEVQQKGVQCPICLDFLCSPITLSCSHSFCRLCLLRARKLAPDSCSCPECRSHITADLSVLSVLPSNQALKALVTEVVPKEVLEARCKAESAELDEFLERSRESLPILCVDGALKRPGQLVHLLFSDPAQCSAITRAWEGDRQCVFCAQRSAQEGDEGLLVDIQRASIRRDGCVILEGIGAERVVLRHTWTDEEASGLYYADVQDPDRAMLKAPAGVRVKELLRRALREGTREYNRGQIAACAEVFCNAAELGAHILRGSGRAERVAVEMLQQGLSQAGRDGDANIVQWTLRRTFAEVLELPLAAPPAEPVEHTQQQGEEQRRSVAGAAPLSARARCVLQ